MTLFIDTHSNIITIALLGKTNIIKQKETNHKHSEHVLNMIKSILDENIIKKEDISEIIVVNGPGSFTGIRIGVVIAKTLSYTLNIKIKVISSLEVFGISENKPFDLIVVEDTKGFYYLTSDLKNPQYLLKNDFEIFVNNHNYIVSTNKEYNFEKILYYSKKIDYSDPKDVNPIYIKRLNV